MKGETEGGGILKLRGKIRPKSKLNIIMWTISEVEVSLNSLKHQKTQENTKRVGREWTSSTFYHFLRRKAKLVVFNFESVQLFGPLNFRVCAFCDFRKMLQISPTSAQDWRQKKRLENKPLTDISKFELQKLNHWFKITLWEKVLTRNLSNSEELVFIWECPFLTIDWWWCSWQVLKFSF